VSKQPLWLGNHPPEHIYLHWPFCAQRCSYCDFVALVGHEAFTKRYHKALVTEIDQFADFLSPKKPQVKTIFMGGGTPSLCPLDLFADIFARCFDRFDVAKDAEISIEANPTGVTDEHFRVWKAAGVNRLSFGVQVLDDKVNDDLGRPQASAEVIDSVQRASKYFDNISVDLIIGLPNVSEEIWRDTLNQVVTWPINHVSMYLLTVYEHTQLFHAVKRGKVRLDDVDRIADRFEWTIDFLTNSGFEQYEISNFSKPGKYSRHNSAYWNLVPYQGFGISASSYDGKRRFMKEKSLIPYLERIETGGGLDRLGRTGMLETLTIANNELETVMLGLRQTKGVAIADILKTKDEAETKRLHQSFKDLEIAGLIERKSGKINLTVRGMMIENEIVASL
jgi:oxygen-independent coproporphyrinogen-3 oxidase